MKKAILAALVVGVLMSPASLGCVLGVEKELADDDNWIDHNNNGIMDPYEDPSLPIEERSGIYSQG